MWKHDCYNEEYQKPKSTIEIINAHGFDIRKLRTCPASRHRDPPSVAENWSITAPSRPLTRTLRPTENWDDEAIPVVVVTTKAPEDHREGEDRCFTAGDITESLQKNVDDESTEKDEEEAPIYMYVTVDLGPPEDWDRELTIADVVVVNNDEDGDGRYAVLDEPNSDAVEVGGDSETISDDEPITTPEMQLSVKRVDDRELAASSRRQPSHPDRHNDDEFILLKIEHRPPEDWSNELFSIVDINRMQADDETELTDTDVECGSSEILYEESTKRPGDEELLEDKRRPPEDLIPVDCCFMTAAAAGDTIDTILPFEPGMAWGDYMDTLAELESAIHPYHDDFIGWPTDR